VLALQYAVDLPRNETPGRRASGPCKLAVPALHVAVNQLVVVMMARGAQTAAAELRCVASHR